MVLTVPFGKVVSWEMLLKRGSVCTLSTKVITFHRTVLVLAKSLYDDFNEPFENTTRLPVLLVPPLAFFSVESFFSLIKLRQVV